MKKIKAKSKCDLVVEEIIRQVSAGRYQPDDRLPPENDWVEQLGVSRVIVREAFKKLETLGVVTIIQGEGTFVRRVSLKDFLKPLLPMVITQEPSADQLYQARLYVERGTARLAARNRSEADLARLKALLERMRSICENADQFSEEDVQFHIQIGKASKNEILATMYEMLKDIIDTCFKENKLSPATVRNSFLYHTRLVELIEARNEDGAEAVMSEHIEDTRRALLSNIQARARSQGSLSENI